MQPIKLMDVHLCIYTAGFQCTVDPNDLENTCTIAWLIKYNPNLLNSVRGGTCDDGTAFNLVDSAAYDQCPVIVFTY